MDVRSRLLDLMSRAGPAHHEAFIETDGADPEWPLWYARFLRTAVAEALDRELTESELTYHLVAIEKQRREQSPDAEWQPYYADELIRRSEAGELGGFE